MGSAPTVRRQQSPCTHRATDYVKHACRKDTEQVRRAAAEVGVAQHAIHFREEANLHEARSAKWLKATVALAVITLLFGVGNVWVYFAYPLNLSTPQSIQLMVAKLLVFSLLYFGVIWCGRIYRSELHNYVVNKHRQNALSTFETFVKAATDAQTKNAVLLQATQSIFAPQHSGFTTTEAESSASPQVLEIIRGFGSDSK